MKIDRYRPKHWLLLAGFGLQAALGLTLRPFLRSRGGIVVLYGHKLNGNLLSLHRHMQAHPEAGLRPVFLSMDRDYLRELRAQGIDACWASGPACAGLLAQAQALVSDHGLHSLGPWRAPYQGLQLRFFDVWHGMSTMAYKPRDTAARHSYDEIWVASELYRKIYTTQFGFDEDRVFVTGHARTDALVSCAKDSAESRARYGLPLDRKIILFAPTWKQQMSGRSIYPFGCGKREFLTGLSNLAANCDAALVVRNHLNSGDMGADVVSNVFMLPASRYPDTESILQACDILVCDWSTIAFDWLLLDRPTIFLDVEPPYPLGSFLGSEFRYGEVVTGFPELLKSLKNVLDDSSEYWKRYSSNHSAAKKKFYGEMADGQATRRCFERMLSSLRE